MQTDKKYQIIKNSVETGYITQIHQIFEHISRTSISKEMGIHYDRFKKMIKNVEEFRISELFYLGRIFGISEEKMLDLVRNHVISKKQGPKKK